MLYSAYYFVKAKLSKFLLDFHLLKLDSKAWQAFTFKKVNSPSNGSRTDVISEGFPMQKALLE